MEFPEHEKLQKVKDQSQAVGSFIEWLSDEKNFIIAQYLESDGYDRAGFRPVNVPVNSLLAEYFEIDQKKLEEEKREMLSILRMANDVPAKEDI